MSRGKNRRAPGATTHGDRCKRAVGRTSQNSTAEGIAMADIIRETGLKYRNWGKWGKDDELGTLNYITPEANLVSSEGAKKNGIHKMARGVVARGVLLDIPRVKGVPWLQPGYAITSDDLDAAVRAHNVTIGTGDALLVRTGQMAMCKQQGGWGDYAGGDAPGLSFSTAGWLHERQLAAIATDTWGMEVRPNEIPDSYQPVHQVLIPNMGMLVGEIFALDELAEDCARDRVFEFLFVAPPLPFTGAVGSPVNPLAIK